MRVLAGAVLLLSLAASAVLFGSLQRGGPVPFTYRADEHLWPDFTWPAKDIPIWRGELPPDLGVLLQDGDQVDLSGVGCRLPLSSWNLRYWIYEAHRGEVSLGRFSEHRTRFYLILAAFPLLAVAAAAILFAGRRRKPLPRGRRPNNGDGDAPSPP